MKSNRGFAITEVLVFSTVIIGVLVFMFAQFKNISRGFQYSFKYDTPEGMYLANNVINYINDSSYDKLVTLLNTKVEGYVDITECNIDNSNLISYCSALFQKSGIEKIYFANENLSGVRQNINQFDSDFKNYINQIKVTNVDDDYRIIIKYTNGSFASMRFNKGNAYVSDGLIAYLDAINNTGNGHSPETSIWRDLSNHGNDAILYNSPTWSSNSIIFDGLSNYGRLENTANMAYSNGVTLETRVKVLSFTGVNAAGHICIFGNWETAGIGLYFMNNYKFRTQSRINNSWQYVEDLDVSSLGEFYTVVTTYDNLVMKQYINGVLKSETAINSNPVILSSPVPFGLAANPNLSTAEAFANLEFQNVLIYDRALTDEEVQRNYRADLARY